MGISEIFIIMLIYAGLYIYTWQMVSSSNKVIVYIKYIFQIILYGIFSAAIWFSYKGEEYHINNHSGLEPISNTGEAILMIVGLSIYSVVLYFLNIHLKRKRRAGWQT
ncbi:peptide ABC transporter permease [Ureibacillus aquaedulcis]|uniref:Peptide ABC transporter permease n=1 Tax=Ureibacillus aquaedulcis TaxID=3058421 RepID=A0ABT8GST6_9BACL|nr:peptide ABC transporter permease [Ureibacillus sp. BA0131]MDN4494481.1 peptide ABC transporter permease [Ureibacillus sp. BA0131]